MNNFYVMVGINLDAENEMAVDCKLNTIEKLIEAYLEEDFGFLRVEQIEQQTFDEDEE